MVILLFSCQKEEYEPSVIGINPDSHIDYHHAFYKGQIFSKTTGKPLTGYTVMNDYLCYSRDTLKDGRFKLHTMWYNSFKFTVPKPDTVNIMLFDTSGYVGSIQFPGDMLIEEDTIELILSF